MKKTRSNNLLNTIRISLALVICRVGGFIRDALQAYYIGVTSLSDYISFLFRIPAMVRSLLNSSLSMLFIPTYIQIHKVSNIRSQNFSRSVFSFFMILIIIIGSLVFLFPHFFLSFMSVNFQVNEYYQDVIFGMRILMIYAVCLCYTQFASLLLNTKRIFFVSTVEPVIFNICLSCYFLLLICFHYTNEFLIYHISLVVSFSGILQCLFLSFFLSKHHIKSLVKPLMSFRNKDFTIFRNRIFIILIISLFGTIPSVIFYRILSYQEGAISAFSYANRIHMFFASLTVYNIVTVLMPSLSEVADNDIKFSSLQQSIIFSLISLSLPLAMFSVLFHDDIIKFLFERGVFDADATSLVADIFFILSCAMPLYSLNSFFDKSLYILKDMKKIIIFNTVKISMRIIVLCLLYRFLIQDFILLFYTDIFLVFLTHVILFAILRKYFKKGFFISFIKRITCVLVYVFLVFTPIYIIYNRILLVVLDFNVSFIIMNILLVLFYFTPIFFLYCFKRYMIYRFLSIENS